MSVDEALEFFQNIPPIKRHMQTLSDVGLGYIKLGQPAPTLSGGEAQRIKLRVSCTSAPRGTPSTSSTSPPPACTSRTSGSCCRSSSDWWPPGTRCLVIEHNLDVVKTADWLIDLGPEGGDQGGRIVAEGPPEAIAANAESTQGRFLEEVLGVPPVGVGASA